MGIVFMYGASARLADSFSLNRDYFFYRQIIYALISFFIMIFLSRINPNIFFRLSIYLIILIIAVLILVLIPSIGIEKNGAKRWISFGYFSFQPSEITKFIVLLFLSHQLSKKNVNSKNFLNHFSPALIIIAIVVILIFLEKDLSTSTVILISSIHLLFISGIKFRYFIYLAITGLPIFYFIITYFEYTKARLSNYLKSFIDEDYASFQSKQALKAISSSDYFGKGFGIGSFHSRIPELHTDFYFASIIADVGLVGGIFFLIIYFKLYVSMFRLANRIQDQKMSYFIIGSALLFSWQTIFNLGSVLGIFPIAGLPLPFLSYGGNSLISSACIIGLILSISKFSVDVDK